MRPLLALALSLPLGGPGPAAPAPPPEPVWDLYNIGGLAVLIGPADTKVGFGGITQTMPVEAAGTKGVATVRQGLLSRDISVTLKEADVREVARLIPDLPGWLKPKLVGRIATVDLRVRGDRFELKAAGFRIPGDICQRIEAVGDLKSRTVTAKVYALGGLLTYEGKLPDER